MKILITTDLYSTDTNGVVTSVKNLSEELLAKGHDIRILTLSDNIRSHKEGFVYYIRSMPIGVYPNVRMPLSYRHRLIKELIEWVPDVIHSQCEFFSFQYARRISKLTGAPIVHTYHTLYEQYVKYLIPSKRIGKTVVRVVSRRRLKRCKCVIAPTYKVEDALRGYGLKNDISIVPSGISLEQHKKRISAEQRSTRRKALGIDENDTVLINLGRLGAEKNLGELIKYYSEAIKENKNLKFLIVGDGPAKEELESLCQQLKIGSQVIFTGMVKPSEVQEYYQLGDVFVSASTSEAQGLTYIEAAANGLPLLCRKDNCLKDVIKQGENGYEYRNAEEFLEMIKIISENTEWREAASKKSIEIADSFDKSSFGDAVEKVYLSALE